MNWNDIPHNAGTPNFDNLLAVLQRQVPKRPTLFEFFLNEPLYERLVPELTVNPDDLYAVIKRQVIASYRLGYDYTTFRVPGFDFNKD